MPIRACIVSIIVITAGTSSAIAQSADPGRAAFEARCARCHGADGNGGEMGPAIARRLSTLDDQQPPEVVRDGVPLKGMPPNVVADPELADLVKFLRTIERRAPPIVRRSLQLTDGRTLDGQLLGEGFDDLQVRTDDNRVHLLRRAGDRYRPVTSETGWPTYNGDPGGNRYTTLTQIDKS